MATVTRTPFAPLDSSRLQTLTNLKNSQNSLTSTLPSASKRKACDLADGDDFENVDPVIFSKRAKATPTGFLTPSSKDSTLKSSLFSIKSSPVIATPRSLPASTPTPAPRTRTILQNKTPITKSKSTVPLKSSPLSSTGRSPSYPLKRAGNTHRRAISSLGRVNSPYTRPLSSSKTTSSFSLSSALKSSIPGFSGLKKPSVSASRSLGLDVFPSTYKREISPSWDFTIYEDSPHEHATNMLQHSTCILDLSSDEETESRVRKENAEGRDKENVPPADDVSQTLGSRPTSRGTDVMEVEQKRSALSDLDASNFWAEGCDDSSVFIIPADEEVGCGKEEIKEVEPVATASPHKELTVEDIMNGASADTKEEPYDNFAIWESESDSADADK